jgi:hypothetical protein
MSSRWAELTPRCRPMPGRPARGRVLNDRMAGTGPRTVGWPSAAVRAANLRVNELPDLAERVSGHSRQVPAKQLIHR